MARALGIGGIFFKARDPESLAKWYEKWLGLKLAFPNGAVFRAARLPEGAATVWSVFGEDSDSMKPSSAPFMINFIVDDVSGVLEQVIAGGARQVGAIEEHDQGKFGWFLDPAGNKVELWQAPPKASAPS